MTADWKDPAFARQWDAAHLAVNPAREAHLALLLEIADRIPAGAILDLGCGSGLVAQMLLEHLPESSVIGTHRFQKLLRRAGLPNLRFHDLRHAPRCTGSHTDEPRLGRQMSIPIRICAARHLQATHRHARTHRRASTFKATYAHPRARRKGLNPTCIPGLSGQSFQGDCTARTATAMRQCARGYAALSSHDGIASWPHPPCSTCVQRPPLDSSRASGRI